MQSTPTLATRFARNTHVIRSDMPLAEDQMRSAAPSIFAPGKHQSRSERYAYIPTIDVLRSLRKEGFEPLFEAVQLRERLDLLTMSNKGMSVTASRELVDELCAVSAEQGIPLFVLHDFDPSCVVGQRSGDAEAGGVEVVKNEQWDALLVAHGAEFVHELA